MNEERENSARLIAATFEPDWAHGDAAGFAHAAAAHARRRRIVRRTLTVAATGAAIVALSVVTSWRLQAIRRAPAPAPEPARGYEIITDDELLSQLHDRPLFAVHQKNGGREFVLAPE